MIFVSDEEIGGEFGMEKFVQHEEFKKMNVAVAIDEGDTSVIVSTNDCFIK